MSHPSEDRSHRFALDRILRQNGYSIVSRPNRGQVLWTRSGTVCSQEEIVAFHITSIEIAKAEQKQQAYLDGKLND